MIVSVTRCRSRLCECAILVIALDGKPVNGVMYVHTYVVEFVFVWVKFKCSENVAYFIKYLKYKV